MGIGHKHLAPAIEDFYHTLKPKVSEEQVQYILELAAAQYAASLKQSISGGWSPGRHPVTAHSATKCYLSNWFQHNKYPREQLSGRVRATFRVGGIVETELYVAALLAGEECTNYQEKLTIPINGWPTNNYIDFIHKSKVDEARRVIDCKTMSSFSFDRVFKQNEGIDDGFGYLGQMNLYVDHCFREGLIDVPEGIFLCYKKDTGHIDEYLIKLDPAKVEEAHANAKIIMAHTDYLDCPTCQGAGEIIGQTTEGVTASIKCGQCLGLKIVVNPKDSVRPPRPKSDDYSPIKQKDGSWKLPLRCSYCDDKWSCWTRPHQLVNFDEENRPVFTDNPLDQFLRVEVSRSGKPEFKVVRRDN